jgi:hypothetical protein
MMTRIMVKVTIELPPTFVQLLALKCLESLDL